MQWETQKIIQTTELCNRNLTIIERKASKQLIVPKILKFV